jgi:hypothetical protein
MALERTRRQCEPHRSGTRELLRRWSPTGRPRNRSLHKADRTSSMITEARVAASCRQSDRAFASWASGYGLIEHMDTIQVRVSELAKSLVSIGRAPSLKWVLGKLEAADRHERCHVAGLRTHRRSVRQILGGD